jgi:transcriptional regulator with XRE-family HTH domain
MLSVMSFQAKLRDTMTARGLNQQKLARASGVSDSEVSRILAGKSQPGLENALKLARAVGVSLDYLADDRLDADPMAESSPPDPWEAESVRIVREMGPQKAVQLLMAAHTLGFEIALRRLFGLEMRPIVEPGDGGAKPPRRGP